MSNVRKSGFEGSTYYEYVNVKAMNVTRIFDYVITLN